jgi:DNA-binding CsgD family transcriptional regulator
MTGAKEDGMYGDPATPNDAACLTPREIDVLRLIASGCTYMQAADRLGVSLHTVASHIKNTYRKLGVRSGAAAVMRAVAMQLLG